MHQSILRTFLSWALLGVLGVVMSLLAGCGGGGGGGGSSSGCGFLGCASGSSSSGTTTSKPSILLTVTDVGSGLASNSLTSGKPLTVKATLLSASGAALSNQVITFATDSALASFDPASGSRLTSSDGTASITLIASSLAANGASLVTATANVDGTSVQGSVAYSVSPGVVTLANLAPQSATLGAYGSTSVSVQVLLNGVLASAPQIVTFTSGCDTTGKAAISRSVSTVNGVATATYTDNGCAGTDLVTASIQGVSMQTSIVVAAPQASNVSFVSAAPSSIALAGTGGAGLSSDSVVTFKVVDSTNRPVASKLVNFDLSTRVGGVLLNNQSSGTVQGTSDASGLVSVTVSAGTVPTPVWVNASLVDNASIKSQSTMLTISTGRPTQDRFSLSVEVFNIEGWRRDGETTKLNVYAFDRLGNPVPNGTAVNFISEGAGVQPSCTTSDGSCSVSFTSGELRPRLDSEPSSYHVSAGRVTVLAYALGEEGFVDSNLNNVYDSGEIFYDLGDAFVDNNENGSWDQGEREISFNVANLAKCINNPVDGRYYNAPSKADTCDGQWGSAHVRRTSVVVLSSYVIGTVSPSVFSMGGACTASFILRLSDENNNPMPYNAKITTRSSVTYLNDQGDLSQAAVGFDGNDIIPSTSAAGGTYHTFTVTGSKCATTPSGTFTLTVTSPSGSASSRTVTINP